MMSTGPTFTGLRLDDRYELRHVLGAGGFATVYLALDRRLHDREVAVKVLHPEHLTSADHVRRFAQEIKVAARIGASCEHLVKITDHGRCAAPPLLYFVMEYLAGPSLRQLLVDPDASALAGRRVQRPLPWSRAVTLVLQLCSAMRALHRQGVIHRDIKPENLIVEASGAGDLLKLLDYGIAKLTPGAAISGDGPRSAVTHVLGTPRYMAPEQLHGGECDHRVDIHAAGAILDELLTGQGPRLPGAPPQPPPSQRHPDGALPPALDAVVRRATAWDPAQRYASADDLSAALVSVLRDAAAAVAADEATTLTVARGAAVPAPLTVAGGATVPAPAPAVAPRPAARASRRVDPAARDRLLLRLGRLSGATFLATSTLAALALVFALFTVVRQARSQSTLPGDRLLREDAAARAEVDDRAPPILPPTRAAESAVATPAPPPSPPEPDRSTDPPAPPATDLTQPGAAEPSPAEPSPAERSAAEPSRAEPSPAPPPAEPFPAEPPPGPPRADPPARAPTLEQIAREAERKIRARCGSRGGDRLVEYTIVFAPGSQRVVEVRVGGEHQGRELGDCVETAALKIDFRGARDRVSELPRALYRM